jgi:hypothetical protein
MHDEFGFRINSPFFIRSRMMFHRVVDHHANNWMYLRRWVKNRNSQHFYFDGVSKTLKTKYRTAQSMQIHSNGNHKLVGSTTTNSRWWQMWRYEAPYVVNQKGKVLDTDG